MSKKDFKNNPAMAFIGKGTQDTQDTLDTQDTQDTLDTQDTQDTNRTSRINLKLYGLHKEYLERVSWHDRTSITQYINDLIAKDKQQRGNL